MGGQRSAIISFISVASIAGSSQRTPSPVVTDVATDLPVSHAPHELIPWGLALGELDARLGSVVEEFIVADPEGSVPGFVVCPTVHGLSFVCCVNCRRAGSSVGMVDGSSDRTHTGHRRHRSAAFAVVFGGEIVIEVTVAHVVPIVGGLLSIDQRGRPRGSAWFRLIFHAVSLQGQLSVSVIMEDTLSGVTVIHAIALPLAGTFQTTISPPIFCQPHRAQAVGMIDEAAQSQP